MPKRGEFIKVSYINKFALSFFGTKVYIFT